MSQDLAEHRKTASLESLGASTDDIYHAVGSYLKDFLISDINNVIDVGCGSGNFLRYLSQNFQSLDLTGTDINQFSDFSQTQIKFIEHDLNNEFPDSFKKYDLVVSLEVIEHIENGRDFIRKLSKIVKEDGHIILSTPNLECYTSLISFFIRGYHSAFGPKNYPAHINPVSVYHMTNMLKEAGDFEIVSTNFINNGRIPGTPFRWHSVFPFLRGKRFSDNYFIHARKKS